MLLPVVWNRTWLAECAEFACIVIEHVIGNYNSLQTITCPFFKGRYKTWTLDSGLDHGLDYGLDYGLDFGFMVF